MEFGIIEFQGEGSNEKPSVAVAPLLWFKDGQCHWPDHLKSDAAVRLAVIKKSPVTDDFKLYPAEVLKSYATYDIARIKLKDATKSTDIESDSQILRRKTRKARSRKNVSTFSDSDEDNPGVVISKRSVPRPPRLKTSMKEPSIRDSWAENLAPKLAHSSQVLKQFASEPTTTSGQPKSSGKDCAKSRKGSGGSSKCVTHTREPSHHNEQTSASGSSKPSTKSRDQSAKSSKHDSEQSKREFPKQTLSSGDRIGEELTTVLSGEDQAESRSYRINVRAVCNLFGEESDKNPSKRPPCSSPPRESLSTPQKKQRLASPDIGAITTENTPERLVMTPTKCKKNVVVTPNLDGSTSDDSSTLSSFSAGSPTSARGRSLSHSESSDAESLSQSESPAPDSPAQPPPQTNTPVSQPSSTTGFSLLKSVVSKVTKLEVVQSKHGLILQEILQRNKNRGVMLEHPKSMPQIPLSTLDEVDLMEGELKEPAKLEYLVKKMSMIASVSKGVEVSVCDIMAQLMKREVAAQFNWKGRGKLKKVPFKNYAICKVVFEAIHIAFDKKADDSIIKLKIQEWLKLSPFRK